jgi:rubrerythrin
MNPDEANLIARVVDPNGNIVEQVLRIACYDEYRANAYYQKVIDTFGAVEPFINIVQAEVRHYGMIERLCVQYGVAVPINDWYEKIQIGSTLQKCCEDGVNAEVANVEMYDYLLEFVTQSDIREVFWREQAASYNNHLPAFSRCVQKYQTFSQTTSEFQNTQSEKNHDLYQLVQGFLRGEMNSSQISKTLSSLANRDMLLGLAIGAGTAMVLNSQNVREVFGKLFNNEKNKPEKEKE